MNGPPTSSSLWTERYESLREHFLQSRQFLGADSLGLTLLRHKGVAGWMGAWQGGSALQPEPTPSLAEPWNPPVAPVWQQELTRLIAAMTAQRLALIPSL